MNCSYTALGKYILHADTCTRVCIKNGLLKDHLVLPDKQCEKNIVTHEVILEVTVLKARRWK